MFEFTYSAKKMACGGNDVTNVVESANHGIKITVSSDFGSEHFLEVFPPCFEFVIWKGYEKQAGIV